MISIGELESIVVLGLEEYDIQHIAVNPLTADNPYFKFFKGDIKNDVRYAMSKVQEGLKCLKEYCVLALSKIETEIDVDRVHQARTYLRFSSDKSLDSISIAYVIASDFKLFEEELFSFTLERIPVEEPAA